MTLQEIVHTRTESGDLDFIETLRTALRAHETNLLIDATEAGELQRTPELAAKRAGIQEIRVRLAELEKLATPITVTE